MRRALITGVSGQDGAYLSRLLLAHGYEVVGTTRGKDPAKDLWRLRELGIEGRVRLVTSGLDALDTVIGLIRELEPDEVYNFAGRSFPPEALRDPLGAADTNAILPLRLLEALVRVRPGARFLQASSSDMFGPDAPVPQNESTPFRPVGPYGHAKLFAHGMVGTYRTVHHLFCCSAILFNHESPLRGEEFVSRKVTRGVARIVHRKQDHVELENLEARRDWGSAEEYVEGMWRMLQQAEPEDYVFATGETHSVRDLAEAAFLAAGIRLRWQGEGLDEKGVDASSGRVVVCVARKHFRREAAGLRCGDARRAAENLGWRPQTRFEEMIRVMVQCDLEREARRA